VVLQVFCDLRKMENIADGLEQLKNNWDMISHYGIWNLQSV